MLLYACVALPFFLLLLTRMNHRFKTVLPVYYYITKIKTVKGLQVMDGSAEGGFSYEHGRHRQTLTDRNMSVVWIFFQVPPPLTLVFTRFKIEIQGGNCVSVILFLSAHSRVLARSVLLIKNLRRPPADIYCCLLDSSGIETGISHQMPHPQSPNHTHRHTGVFTYSA